MPRDFWEKINDGYNDGDEKNIQASLLANAVSKYCTDENGNPIWTSNQVLAAMYRQYRNLIVELIKTYEKVEPRAYENVQSVEKDRQY